MERAHRLLLHASTLLLLVTGSAALAQEAAEPGTSRAEILTNLQELQRSYGNDAVLMQGTLLSQASRSGSIADDVVSVSGFEERQGKRFLTFKLDTGIIYNDRDLSRSARQRRVWGDIVEISLRKFHSLNVPADGIALLISYDHAEYEDEAALRAKPPRPTPEREVAAFYLLSGDVADLLENRIAAQQLVDRSVVLLNGLPSHIQLEAPSATPSPSID